MRDEDIGKEYLAYATKTHVGSARTRQDYLNSLRNLQPVRRPVDLADYLSLYGTNLTDKQRKGLGKLWGFLRVRKNITSINGFPIANYEENLTIAERGKSNMTGRLKDLTAEEIRTARDTLPRDIQIYYSLMAYSGARHSQLIKAFRKPRPVEIIGDIARVDVHDLSEGTKYAYWYYFPVELAPVIKDYTCKYGYDALQKVIAASGTNDRPVNVASLRKWNYNMLISNGEPKIESLPADFIQGRSQKQVGGGGYADPDSNSREGYLKVVSKFRKMLPVPDWMKEGVWDIPQKKHRVSNGGKGKSRIDATKQKEIIDLLKKGSSDREIARILKCGRATVQKIKKEQMPK